MNACSLCAGVIKTYEGYERFRSTSPPLTCAAPAVIIAAPISACRGLGVVSADIRAVQVRRSCAFAESPLVGGKQILNRMLPREFLLDPDPPEFAHSPSLLGPIEQPQNFAGEIRDLIDRVSIQGCALRAKSTLLRVKLDN